MRPMSDVSQRLEKLALPLRPQDAVDCRGCEVHCDKVVYPSACLDRSCPFAYAYEEHGHTFIGCMQKVYETEIDLDMLRMAERRREGFGAIRAIRAAAADVPLRDRAVLRAPRGGARLCQPGVQGAAGGIADIPGDRPAPLISGTRRSTSTPSRGQRAAATNAVRHEVACSRAENHPAVAPHW